MVINNTVLFPPSLTKVFLLVMLSLIMTNPVYSQTSKADSELSVFISNSNKQWGQFLRVTLHYHGPKMLTDIDLKAWQQLIAVKFEDEYNDEDENGNPIQVLQLRLHPRKIGHLKLPPLKMGKAVSQAMNINISQPVIKNSPINLNWQVSTLSPWQREAVLVRVHVRTTDYAAHIQLKPPEHKQFLSRALKTERHKLADGSYQFNAGWVLYPIDNGLLELDLPPVRYQIAGSDRRQFYLPLQKFNVKALPNYLPPTLPVGKLNLDSKTKYDKAGNKQWQLNIATDALIPYGIPELDAQLAAISKQDIANIEMKYTQQSDYSEFGDRSIYLSPMPEWLMPFGKDLKLTLRFFDTKTGRLGNISHNLPRRWVMPSWAWWITIACVFIIGGFLFQYLQPWLLTQTNRIKLRHQLHKATSIKQMRRIILERGQFVTLSEWTKDNNARNMAISKLNYLCFSASPKEDSEHANIQQLKETLIKLA